MGSAIGLRDDFDGTALRQLARKSKSANQARRLLALAQIYDGGSRSEAAKIGGVTLQIVRDWVLRFNARGPDGLLDGKALRLLHRVGNLFLSISTLLHGTLLHNQGYNTGKLSFKLEEKTGRTSRETLLRLKSLRLASNRQQADRPCPRCSQHRQFLAKAGWGCRFSNSAQRKAVYTHLLITWHCQQRARHVPDGHLRLCHAKIRVKNPTRRISSPRQILADAVDLVVVAGKWEAKKFVEQVGAPWCFVRKDHLPCFEHGKYDRKPGLLVVFRTATNGVNTILTP